MAQHLGIILALAVGGYIAWQAAMWGLLGGWLVPRGEDVSKIASAERLKSSLKVGMAADDAKAAIIAAGQEWSESCIKPTHWPCPRPEGSDDYILWTAFKKVRWLGVVTYDIAVDMEVHGGIVKDIRIGNLANGP